MYYSKYKVMKTMHIDTDKIKVAIVGSRVYENKYKIKEMIFKLKTKFGDRLQIVSGGAKDGADKYAKKFALELGIDYKEFNPAYTSKNLYSGMPENYYGKPYHISQLFHRNTLIAQYSDYMVAFIDTRSTSGGSDHVVNEFKKLGKEKNVVIVNEKA